MDYAAVVTSAPRRSPAPEDRRRDADRSRRALLDAALAEFAAKGFEGARVGEIAGARAGVNKQLVSYYFDGKQGLYEAVLQRWYELEEEIAEPGISLGRGGGAATSRRATITPSSCGIWLRENLDQDPSTVAYEPDAPEVEDLRARQRAGEIADELDPAFIQLALQAIVMSGVIQPGEVKRFLGMDPSSREYLEYMDTQIRRLVRRLGAPAGGPVAEEHPYSESYRSEQRD